MAPHGLPDAPAPWQLTAEVFAFFGYLWTPTMPPGGAHELEESALVADRESRLYRGLYGVEVYRYKTSPVGPYDEIMFVPGSYLTTLSNGKTALNPRITRIYVSTDASIYNGRKNWNIPKHKAHFSFDYRTDGSVGISVSLPGSDSPFFAAKVTPSKWLPRLSINTSWVPLDLRLIQPPLPDIDEIRVGTDKWQQIPFTIVAPKSKVAYLAPALKDGKAFADRNAFPDTPGLSLGIHCEHATIDFGMPVAIEVAERARTPQRHLKAD